jgi:DNA-binding NarL/FixJ family response regulator
LNMGNLICACKWAWMVDVVGVAESCLILMANKVLPTFACSCCQRMDIQMPTMDGLEATRRLRQMGYVSLPIFGLTASVARSDFRDLGFDDWLPKPVPMKELKAKLNHLQATLLATSNLFVKQ